MYIMGNHHIKLAALLVMLYVVGFNTVGNIHNELHQLFEKDRIQGDTTYPHTHRSRVGSPTADPSCMQINGSVFIDGGNECYGAQLGNFLAALYLSAIRSKQRRNSFAFHCYNGSATIFEQLKLDLPALNFDLSSDLPDLCVNCTNLYAHSCETGLNYALPLIILSLGGIEAPDSLDDVTLHFRCGDILSYPFREYGYPRYRAYNFTPYMFNSIGILTASLDVKHSRTVDIENAEKCKSLLFDMADYFTLKYPHINVTIRNTDSVKDAYGRMIHSKLTWCNPSTFCVFPTLANVGHGFIVNSDLYPFVRKIKSDHLKLVFAEILTTRKIVRKKMTTRKIIQWLRS
jgi:hypothetical protein